MEDSMLAVLNDNIQEVIRVASLTLGPWFLVHLVPALEAVGPRVLPLVNRPLPKRQGGYSQEEHYTLEYVLSVLHQPSLLHLVPTYLLESPCIGKAVMREVMQLSCKAQDNFSATKAYYRAIKYGAQVYTSNQFHDMYSG